MVKNRAKTNLRREGKASIVEVMQDNRAGAPAYKIQDPSERLIATIGTSMNEPKFYPTDPGSQSRGYKYNVSDFDQQAQLVINTAFEVAESKSPKDLVQIAHWARKELKMRTLPQVLLAIAGHCKETKPFVREYVPKVINRADELKQAFIANRSLFGAEKSLPNALKRGLADAFATFKEYDYLKYEGQHRPHFSDVLKMIERKKGYPLNESLSHYLNTGEVKDEKQIPIIAARKKLAKLKTFGPRAISLATKSRATWEVLVSQFGGTKEIWEHLIESNALGYMALMRNMRNILQAGVSDECLSKVASKIENGAVKSKQLPFRFLMAKQILEKECHGLNGTGIFSNALNKAVEAVAEAGNTIPGNTLSVVDTSGSMQTPVSGKSNMTAVGAGAMLAGILHACSTGDSETGIFANTYKKLPNLKDKGPLDVAKSITNAIGEVGHGTNAEDVLRQAIASKKKFDRIVVFSDMQTYGGQSYRWGGYPSARGGASMSELWKQYKEEVNPNAKLHTIDLMGYGTSVSKQGDDTVNLVSGFSEKLLDTILRFEGVNPETGVQTEDKREFTIEYVRKNY